MAPEVSPIAPSLALQPATGTTHKKSSFFGRKVHATGHEKTPNLHTSKKAQKSLGQFEIHSGGKTKLVKESQLPKNPALRAALRILPKGTMVSGKGDTFFGRQEVSQQDLPQLIGKFLLKGDPKPKKPVSVGGMEFTQEVFTDLPRQKIAFLSPEGVATPLHGRESMQSICTQAAASLSTLPEASQALRDVGEALQTLEQKQTAASDVAHLPPKDSRRKEATKALRKAEQGKEKTLQQTGELFAQIAQQKPKFQEISQNLLQAAKDPQAMPALESSLLQLAGSDLKTSAATELAPQLLELTKGLEGKENPLAANALARILFQNLGNMHFGHFTTHLFNAEGEALSALPGSRQKGEKGLNIQLSRRDNGDIELSAHTKVGLQMIFAQEDSENRVFTDPDKSSFRLGANFLLDGKALQQGKLQAVDGSGSAFSEYSGVIASNNE